jgi:hypothetical protein
MWPERPGMAPRLNEVSVTFFSAEHALLSSYSQMTLILSGEKKASRSQEAFFSIYSNILNRLISSSRRQVFFPNDGHDVLLR